MRRVLRGPLSGESGIRVRGVPAGACLAAAVPSARINGESRLRLRKGAIVVARSLLAL